MPKSPTSFRRPIPAKLLRWRCPGSTCRGAARRASLLETIGQPEAIAALRLGLELYAPGYNVFVVGLPFQDRAQVLRHLLEEMSPRCVLPLERVYVHNFLQPERPRLIELPRGEGSALLKTWRRAGELLADSIRRLAEDEVYARRRDEIQHRYREEERKVADAFEKLSADRGFTPGTAGQGPAAEPDVFYVVGQSAVGMSDLDAAIRAGAVKPEEEEKIRAAHRELRDELATTIRRTRAIAHERQEEMEKLERSVASRILDDVTDVVSKHFPYPEIEAFLAEVRTQLADRFPLYARALMEAAEQTRGRPDTYRLLAEQVLREFRINLLLDTRTIPGCPVVLEHKPTWTNLFGQIEREVDPNGNVRVDHLLIRAGSLLRADGGYLVMQVVDVLREGGVWDELKSVLKHGRLEIRVPDALAGTSPVSLRPEPISVTVKVILIGDEGAWYALRDADPEFAEIFKVKASFDRDTPLDASAIRRYASYFHRLAERESRLHLDESGLAAIVEEGVREGGRQGRISVRFTRIADLVREADFLARGDGAPIITGDHVRRAVKAATRRASVEERRVREAVRDGLILVQTDGTRVGTVNGLAVYDFGDHRFGKVARITATVGAGPGGVVNVERLVKLSGQTHDKGVLILTGYLRQTFASHRPIGLTGSLVFEQSYGGIEGDSATCAELFALVSALAGIPARQDLAVTGSMNQHGEVQAVGGVNDKVEGFYDLCAERGLTGTQGVIIPAANARDLMLRHDVVDACAAGKFAVYAIDHVEQGVELLLGRPAGRTEEVDKFRKGSVYAAVAERIAATEVLVAARPESPPDE